MTTLKKVTALLFKELNESQTAVKESYSDEIARELFYSLVKLGYGGYSILNDGYFVEKIYANSDEEAIAKFHELNRVAREERNAQVRQASPEAIDSANDGDVIQYTEGVGIKLKGVGVILVEGRLDTRKPIKSQVEALNVGEYKRSLKLAKRVAESMAIKKILEAVSLDEVAGKLNDAGIVAKNILNKGLNLVADNKQYAVQLTGETNGDVKVGVIAKQGGRLLDLTSKADADSVVATIKSLLDKIDEPIHKNKSVFINADETLNESTTNLVSANFIRDFEAELKSAGNITMGELEQITGGKTWYTYEHFKINNNAPAFRLCTDIKYEEKEDSDEQYDHGRLYSEVARILSVLKDKYGLRVKGNSGVRLTDFSFENADFVGVITFSSATDIIFGATSKYILEAHIEVVEKTAEGKSVVMNADETLDTMGNGLIVNTDDPKIKEIKYAVTGILLDAYAEVNNVGTDNQDNSLYDDDDDNDEDQDNSDYDDFDDIFNYYLILNDKENQIYSIVVCAKDFDSMISQDAINENTSDATLAEFVHGTVWVLTGSDKAILNEMKNNFSFSPEEFVYNGFKDAIDIMSTK